jgi:hypothetical protein
MHFKGDIGLFLWILLTFDPWYRFYLASEITLSMVKGVIFNLVHLIYVGSCYYKPKCLYRHKYSFPSRTQKCFLYIIFLMVNYVHCYREQHFISKWRLKCCSRWTEELVLCLVKTLNKGTKESIPKCGIVSTVTVFTDTISYYDRNGKNNHTFNHFYLASGMFLSTIKRCYIQPRAFDNNWTELYICYYSVS